MQVKDLISSRVSLAPMAGITDYVLRTLVRENSSSALLTTEMISSEFLTQCKGGDIIMRDKTHSPISYQLSGHKPKMIADCAKYLEQYADMIDINMGCPVNKVVKGTDGCALMRNTDLAQEIVKTVKASISIPLSVKFRLGYTFDELNFVEFGEKMQEAGADFITIHGRTRSQMYSGEADWTLLGEVKNNPRMHIPVIGNGDINSPEKAADYKKRYGVDAVMIGRAAIGNPWIFKQIRDFEQGRGYNIPDYSERVEVCLEHLQAEAAAKGDRRAVLEMRKHYAGYFKAIPYFKETKLKLMEALSVEEIFAAFRS